MIVDERVNKDQHGISKRMNELGLTLPKVRIVDWNPQWAILIYDDQDIFASKKKEAG